jgi:hypothetical protein
LGGTNPDLILISIQTSVGDGVELCVYRSMSEAEHKHGVTVNGCFRLQLCQFFFKKTQGSLPDTLKKEGGRRVRVRVASLSPGDTLKKGGGRRVRARVASLSPGALLPNELALVPLQLCQCPLPSGIPKRVPQ